MKLTKKQRENIRMMFGGKCAYCGCELGEKGWHADHVKNIERKLEWHYDNSGKLSLRSSNECHKPENDVIENIFPSCAPCNIFKSSMDLEWFRTTIESQLEKAHKYSANYRVAKRFGLIEETPRKIIFHFESFNRNLSTPTT
jgi:hypothetical protein